MSPEFADSSSIATPLHWFEFVIHLLSVPSIVVANHKENNVHVEYPILRKQFYRFITIARNRDNRSVILCFVAQADEIKMDSIVELPIKSWIEFLMPRIAQFSYNVGELSWHRLAEVLPVVKTRFLVL